MTSDCDAEIFLRDWSSDVCSSDLANQTSCCAASMAAHMAGKSSSPPVSKRTELPPTKFGNGTSSRTHTMESGSVAGALAGAVAVVGSRCFMVLPPAPVQAGSSSATSGKWSDMRDQVRPRGTLVVLQTKPRR